MGYAKLQEETVNHLMMFSVCNY